MARTDQLNSLLLKELADLTSKNVYLENGLITISYVEISPDLRYASIGVSVLPDNLSATAIKKLNHQNWDFSKQLKKKLKLKFIPKFNWKIDNREKYAAEIEEAIKNIND
jgi:ribosome-binding factor A